MGVPNREGDTLSGKALLRCSSPYRIFTHASPDVSDFMAKEAGAPIAAVAVVTLVLKVRAL